MGKRSESDFRSPLRSPGEDKVQVHGHFGSEQGQEMRLLSIAKKRGLFLQQKLGLVSALRPTGYFFFSFLSFAPLRWGWGLLWSPKPCIGKQQFLIARGLWDQKF